MTSGWTDSSCARNSALLRILWGWATGMPAARAVCLRGGATSSWARPTGRSGWVMASAMSWPAACNASSVGTAKRGVPQKTNLTELPRALALHLANFAQRHVALQPAHAEDEQHAVEVVDLVLEGAGQQFVAVHLKPFAVCVLRTDFHFEGTDDLFTDLGKAEAAFLFVLLALLEDDLRIDQNQF